MNGLTGPQHDLATQEAVLRLTALQKELRGEISDEKLRPHIWSTLKSGKVRAPAVMICLLKCCFRLIRLL
ncbi:hypothetical protein SKAU_G00150720 [Synaphobranchus kaupii]|uniref:Uncharacterized protein n=1 Tax=Synaphobranchus kaupii TaxID=118154 RepID=A0A9Q1IYX7_SYNKA|nr:hypothetical protein SKAU_G00150720 [Synaphobranchus kaupii]